MAELLHHKSLYLLDVHGVVFCSLGTKAAGTEVEWRVHGDPFYYSLHFCVPFKFSKRKS